MTGQLNINEVVGIIEDSTGVLCPDSGLMHIADALNIPLIALYVPTVYDRTRPTSRNSIILKSQRLCLGCLKNTGWNEQNTFDKCPYDIACMKEITSNSVYNKIIEMNGKLSNG